MVNTGGRPGSRRWLNKHFDDYQTETGYIVLKKGTGRISGRRYTRETSPWKFWPGGFGEPSIYGYTVQPKLGGWYNQFIKTPMTQDEYDKFLKSLNWFKNGGRTMFGGVGLDPRVLIGGYREWDKSDSFICPQGTYTPANVITGKPASFVWRTENREWHGDHGMIKIPVWQG
jgi:hypothetical protein